MMDFTLHGNQNADNPSTSHAGHNRATQRQLDGP
jgi:hypothetical protein